MERLLDKRALAEVLGVSVKTIDKWVSERRIPFVRITGKCVRFLPGAVLTYLEKSTVYPAEDGPVKTRYPAEGGPVKTKYPTEDAPVKTRYPAEDGPVKTKYPAKEAPVKPKRRKRS